ncbi:hypothetical protein XI25_29250 [Paenibacillus sp. DMB20]|nr:hypothetical protein XI25_29250 [Paenibacillus sp. DMB20]
MALQSADTRLSQKRQTPNQTFERMLVLLSKIAGGKPRSPLKVRSNLMYEWLSKPDRSPACFLVFSLLEPRFH